MNISSYTPASPPSPRVAPPTATPTATQTEPQVVRILAESLVKR